MFEWKSWFEIGILMKAPNPGLGFATMSDAMGKAVNYPSWIVRHFSPFISGRLLEVGLGFANYQPLYSVDAFVGADIDGEVVAAATKKFSQSSFVQAELGSKEFAPKVFRSIAGRKFDTCVCFNTLQYLEDERFGVKQLLDVIRVGGHVCVLVPANQFLYGSLDRGSHHRYRYSRSKAKEICSHDCAEIISFQYFNAVGGITWGGYNLVQFIRNRFQLLCKSEELILASGGEAGADFFDRHLVSISKLLQPVFRSFFGLSFAIVLQKTKN